MDTSSAALKVKRLGRKGHGLFVNSGPSTWCPKPFFLRVPVSHDSFLKVLGGHEFSVLEGDTIMFEIFGGHNFLLSKSYHAKYKKSKNPHEIPFYGFKVSLVHQLVYLKA